MIFASFLDAGGNGFDIVDLLILFTVPAAIAGLFLSVRKAKDGIANWAQTTLRELIRKELAVGREDFAVDIGILTQPIQKDGNGGRSLADANRKLDLIANHLALHIPVNLKADKE